MLNNNLKKSYILSMKNLIKHLLYYIIKIFNLYIIYKYFIIIFI